MCESCYADEQAEVDGDFAATGCMLIFAIVLLAAIAGFIFFGCAAHAAPLQGDCDGNGQIDISDAVCLINYIFLGIEPPRLEWWERDTVATVLVFDGRSYIMRNHNISLWRQFIVAGNDTGVVEWYRIGESMRIDSNKIVEVRK